MERRNKTMKILKPKLNGGLITPAILKTVVEQLHEHPLKDGPLEDYRAVRFKNCIKDSHKLWKLKYLCDIVRIDNLTYYAKFHDNDDLKDIILCAYLIEKYNSNKNIFKTIDFLDSHGVFFMDNERLKINKKLVGFNKSAKLYFSFRNLIEAGVIYKDNDDYILNEDFIKKGENNA